jgi:hypothetical protein
MTSDFPSEKNPQPCKNGCGAKIYLSNKNQSRRYLPYDLDGTVHDCPKKSQNGSTTTKPDSNKEDKMPTIKELDARLRKLESLVLGD